MIKYWKSALLVAIAAAVSLLMFSEYFTADSPPLFIDGYTADGFQDVLQIFRENFESGRDSQSGGSAFAAYYRGEKVVDVWGGYADVESRQILQGDTLILVYSATKAVAALCLAMLVDRGLLQYDRPVAHYWPEFAQKGKGEITVRQLLEHKGGLVFAAPPGLSLELLRNVSEAGELMASTEPLWKMDGTTHGYHGITIGPLTNELLRRVDPKHRTLGQFFAEEVAQPFGVDFFVGLPLEENHRAARAIIDMTPPVVRLISYIFNPEHRLENWHLLTSNMIQMMLQNGGDIAEFHRFNDPANRALELPSVNGMGTAESLAKILGILAAGGTDRVTDIPLLSRKLIDDFLDAEPPSLDLVLGLPVSFNRGMMVEELVAGVKMFGHVGAGGQLVFADPENQIGFAFLSSFQMPVIAAKHERSLVLVETLYKCIKKLGG